MTTAKILVIEDEADIREVMEYTLARYGFRVVTAGEGGAGVARARAESPDLILLDLMLPDMDGNDVFHRLRQDDLTRSIPVIMVTAKGEEADVVLGLGLGADDYVTKPFSPRELVARVKAVLRRGQLRSEPRSGERLVHGGLVIDAGRHEVRVDGASVPFTATELRLLHLLASHPGRVFDRDQLLNRIIGEKAVVISRNIDVHVRAIRKKLGTYACRLETVRGVGYRFRDPDAAG